MEYSKKHNEFHLFGASKSRKHETPQKGFEIGGEPVNKINRGKLEYVKNTIDVQRLVREEISSLNIDTKIAFQYSDRSPDLGDTINIVDKILASGVVQRAVYNWSNNQIVYLTGRGKEVIPVIYHGRIIDINSSQTDNSYKTPENLEEEINALHVGCCRSDVSYLLPSRRRGHR